jgi:hypothetical protein
MTDILNFISLNYRGVQQEIGGSTLIPAFQPQQQGRQFWKTFLQALKQILKQFFNLFNIISNVTSGFFPTIFYYLEQTSNNFLRDMGS